MPDSTCRLVIILQDEEKFHPMLLRRPVQVGDPDCVALMTESFLARALSKKLNMDEEPF